MSNLAPGIITTQDSNLAPIHFRSQCEFLEFRAYLQHLEIGASFGSGCEFDTEQVKVRNGSELDTEHFYRR